MRKSLLFFFIVIIPSVILAQSIKGGLIAGANVSQVDGDECIGYHKMGLNVGALAIVPFAKDFSFSIETLFDQKGSYQRPQYYDSLDGEYKLILNYVDIPVLFHYTDKDIISVGAGFSWGRLVQFKEWQNDTRVNWSDTVSPYKKNDVDVILDLQFKLIKGLYFDFRYAYSVAKIRSREFHNITKTWSRDQYNNVLAFRLIYVFKDKPTPKKSKTTTINKS